MKENRLITLFRCIILICTTYSTKLKSASASASASASPLQAKSLEVKCSIGWGSSSEIERSIPSDWINDGYCDCPLDGIDEPDTGACSGSANWAGVDFMQKPNEPSKHSFYQCPFEPDHKLPLSQINDGICDCCNGSDETLMKCTDNCEEMRLAFESKMEKIKVAYKEGSLKRLEELAQYEEFVQKTKNRFTTIMQQEIPKIEKNISEIEKILEAKQKLHLSQRRDMVIEIAKKISLIDTDNDSNTLAVGLFEALDANEIIDLIVGSCQLSAKGCKSKESLACEPLVQAGLDLGFIWEEKNTNLFKVDGSDEEDILTKRIIDEILLKNNEKIESDNVHEEEEQFYDDDDDEEDSHFYKNNHGSNSNVDKKREVTSTTDDQLKNDGNSVLIISRSKLKKSAETLLDKINSLLSTDDDNDTNNSEDKQPDEASTHNVDPVAIQKVRSKLVNMLKDIKKEENTASAARSQMDAFLDNEDVTDFDLMALASGVIYHSRITSADIVELIYNIVPEFSLKEDLDNDHVCQNLVCKPNISTIQRQSFETASEKLIQLPPPILLSLYNERCDKRDALYSHTANICKTTLDDESTPVLEIPNEIHDGYMNFYSFTARVDDDEDPLSTMYEQLSESSKNLGFESELELINIEKSDLDSLINERTSLVNAMDDVKKYGDFGELHALRELCFSVIAAKYDYEICFFDKAFQYEATGGSKTGGTSLGRWNGYSYGENGEIIVQYTRGQRCWNGPERSATVYITCGGEETRLLSVEEPDTCRYEMKMESHIACSNEYAVSHGIDITLE